MEIILLETIDRLGSLGDLVKVRAGFARNYLLPQGKAKLATAENIAEIEARRAELEKQQAAVLVAAKTRAEQLEGLEVSIAAKSGGEGKLFGSITNANITDAINEKGIDVEKSEIRMPEGPIRVAGEYDIDVHLHAEVNATIKLIVIGEED
ncbi:MAG: 50S ribosomal protein L9 [Gammaproteobacteria bacterium]|nr:50S ribosomal protein L9 [Gammaproteobacteria bacterium]NNJ97004.1 50S ribosomal protein L9 [Gammaproteobacteria bacterium]